MRLVEITEDIAIDLWSVTSVFIDTLKHTGPSAEGFPVTYTYRVVVFLEHDKLVAGDFDDKAKAVSLKQSIIAKLKDAS